MEQVDEEGSFGRERERERDRERERERYREKHRERERERENGRGTDGEREIRDRVPDGRLVLRSEVGAYV